MRYQAIVCCFLTFACSREATPDGKPAAEVPAAPLPAAQQAEAATVTQPAQAVVTTPAAPEQAAPAPAALGVAAPAFTLPDLAGQSVSLADFKGKTVVLEWFNPQCPFVKLSHTKGSLVGLADKHTKQGVVWLAINSGAPGKQGHGVEASSVGKQAFNIAHPILIDATGSVGRAYGAKTTPHVFVIDGAGKLVYRGAIDNSPDGEKESPEGGKLVNYVDQALQDLKAGRPVAAPDTKPYGCSVKYGT
jgi:peroxiredoxin